MIVINLLVVLRIVSFTFNVPVFMMNKVPYNKLLALSKHVMQYMNMMIDVSNILHTMGY